MKYTTLEDLKKWPKLYKEACRLTVEAGNDPVDSADLNFIPQTFSWRSTPQGHQFWHCICNEKTEQACDISPELFEEASPIEKAKLTPCERLGYKVGDRFRVIEDDSDYYDPGEIVYLIYDDRSGVPEFCREMTPDREEARYLKLSEVVPLADQEQGEKLVLQSKTISELFRRDSADQCNAAMIDRDGPEEPCNTDPTANPMAKHADTLSRALSVAPFAITKFDSRGL